ncbi:MAG: hypothetical protein AB8G22_25305 [Saprospiraceae bacterium]
MSKKKETNKPNVHDDLKGFEVKLNEFGEIKTNVQVDKINDFLNKNVEDKKLKERDEKLAEAAAEAKTADDEWNEIMGEEE